MGSRGALGCLIAVVVVIAIVGFSIAGTYNNLVRLGQAVDAQWAQVENVYQRRADLIPNLVATVKGAANFEKSTYIAVTEARAKVGQVTATIPQNVTSDPQNFAKFVAAQDSLGSAISRLLAVVENYPDLKASENFLTLQSQLEGTENRIAVERMRYNDVAREYNTTLQSFPTNLIAGLFGGRFPPKEYFKAQPGAQTAPQVQF
jgi:LemA protein